jgi:BioD-like phosphotransacetylase family protein
MKAIYLAAVEEKAGKTSLAVGLGRLLGERGLAVSYRKPVGWASTYHGGRPFDGDAVVMAKALSLSESPEELVPVLAWETPRAWRPPEGAWERILALRDVEAEVLILEGRKWLGRGLLSGLSDMAIAGRLGAPILLVASYRGEPTVDRLLAARRLVGNEARVVGVVLNEVSADTELAEVRGYVAPFLEERELPVLGVIPFERRLRTVPVGAVVRELGAEILVTGDLEAEVERFLIGAMGGEAALRHLRRIPGQLGVVTGGDRTDIQAAAIAFPRVRVLILTGGLRPEQSILTRAAERGITLALAAQDTMTVAEAAEGMLGRFPLSGERQLGLVDQLVREGLDLDRLLEQLG